jgi:hypothetical protein
LPELKIWVDTWHAQEQTEDSDLVEDVKAEEISLSKVVFFEAFKFLR